MTDLIRRLLWWFTSSALTSVLLFLVLISASSSQASRLPLLFNPQPISSSREAESLLALAKQADARIEERIARLGTIFALHAIPRLGSLSVASQARVLIALRPVRARTGDTSAQLGLDSDPKNLSEDLLFWQRFTEERQLDFRPPARTRIVRRWLQGELSIRRRELFALDTYALPELVAELGSIKTEEDVARARLLVPAIARLTQEPWRLTRDADPDQVSHTVANIRRYFDRNGGLYRDPAPLEMVAEVLSQTEFAVLVGEVGRGLLGIERNEDLERAFLDLNRASPGIFAGFLGAFALGPLIAAALGLGRIRWPRLSRSLWELPLAGVALLSFGLLQLDEAPGYVELGGCALFSATTVAFLLTEELNQRLHFRVLSVLVRRSTMRRLAALLREFSPTALALVPVTVLEVVLVPVLCSGSEGRPTILKQIAASMTEGQLEYPMACGLAFIVAVATLELITNPLVGALGRGLKELH